MKSNSEKYSDIVSNLRKLYFLDKIGHSTSRLSKYINDLTSIIDYEPLDESMFSGERLNLNDFAIPENSESFDLVKNELNSYLARVQKSGHPRMMKNINPAAFIPSIAFSAIADLYMPNACTEEMSGNIALIEKILIKEVSKFLNLDSNKSAGFFTFGGTSTINYAVFTSILKLKRLYPDIKHDSEILFMASKSAHEALKTCLRWQHIPESNLIEIKTNNDMTLDLIDLERQLISVGKKKGNVKVAMIQCGFGTTSNFALDNPKEVYKILKAHYKKEPKPHIHMDSVAGWVYGAFLGYDIKQNNLSIPHNVLEKIAKAVELIHCFTYADSFGVDFHKTGYSSYPSSLAIFKTFKDLAYLKHDLSEVPHLYSDNSLYNPGKLTFETSRSGADILGSWITLRMLGKKGIRSIWANSLFFGVCVEEELSKNQIRGFILPNINRYGVDILFRVTESINLDYLKDTEQLIVKENNIQTKNFYDWLSKNQKKYSIGYTRSCQFDSTNNPKPAIRIYNLSLYADKALAKELVADLLEYKNQFSNSPCSG